MGLLREDFFTEDYEGKKLKINAHFVRISGLLLVCGIIPVMPVMAKDKPAMNLAPNILRFSGPFYQYSHQTYPDPKPARDPYDWQIENCARAYVSNGLFYATSAEKDASIMQAVTVIPGRASGITANPPGGKYIVEASLTCDVPDPAHISVRWRAAPRSSGCVDLCSEYLPDIGGTRRWPITWTSAWERADVAVEGDAREWRHVRAPVTIAPDVSGPLDVDLFVLFPSGSNISVVISNVALMPDVSVGRITGKLLVGPLDEAVPLVGIYITDEEYVKRAALMLRWRLKELTGSLLPVLPACRASAPGGIFLGPAALKAGTVASEEMREIGASGYLLKCADDRVSIVGKTPAGLLPGVFKLLEQLGWKYYLSDLYAKETRKVYHVTPLVIKKTPAFEILSAYGAGGNDWLECLGYTDETMLVGNPRCLVADVIGARGGWGHDAALLVPHELYLKSHPEYYARDAQGKLKGSSSEPALLHLCLSNPDVRRIALESVLRWMDLQPDRKLFPVTRGDGIGFCECEECRKLDPPRGDYTDRDLQFVNSIARGVRKKHPDKRVVKMAYGGRSDEVPVYTKPEPNVDLLYCAWVNGWGCKQHAMCKLNWKGIRDVIAWTQLMPGRVYAFDYPWNVYANVDKMRFFAALGVKGYFTCGFRGEFVDLQAYLIGRLQWDIDMDIESAITEFMNHYYGEAAAGPMREYFNLVQDALAATQLHRNETAGANRDIAPMIVPFQPGDATIITAELADRAYALFDQALAAAGTNAVFADRINKERYGVLMTDLTKRNPRRCEMSKSETAIYAERLATMLRMARAGPTGLTHVQYNEKRRLYWSLPATKVFYGTPIKTWLWDIARIPITNDNAQWFKDKAVVAFLADPDGYLTTLNLEKLSNGWKGLAPPGVCGGQSSREYQNRMAIEQQQRLIQKPN